jgi:hypothetical protein
MDIKLVVIQVQINACRPKIANLAKAFNKEFYTNAKRRTRHTSHTFVCKETTIITKLNDSTAKSEIGRKL